MIETYLESLDLGYYEAQFAFQGLADENVWKRPAEGILSVGELAGHTAYWEALRWAGDNFSFEAGPDDCPVKSPLIDTRFRYHPNTVAQPPSPEHLAMSAAQVWAELQRVHQESMALLRGRTIDLNAGPPGSPHPGTYRDYLKYQAFHIAYHVGQMYTVRHLLGETPPDN